MELAMFLGRRLGRLLVTVLIISTLIFFIVRIIPGDPALIIAGVDASKTDLDNIRAKLGTDRPVLIQYFEWLANILRLDFGKSLISGEPVMKLILARFPLTLAIATLGMITGLLFAIPLGVISAVRRWSPWDYAGLVFSQLGMALPSFWLGIVLLLVFAVAFPVFPLFGVGTPAHLVLPVLALGFERSAVILRLTRASMVEELSKEYVVTARSKGLTEKMVKYKHALKNALLPVVTITGIQFGYMLGGAIIVEQVFSLPGLGRLFLFGVYQRDFPLIQGGVMFVAIVFSLVNFAADVLYSLVNPRIRME